MQPPPSPDVLGEPLYETFYGLREQPFALTTDPRFLFLSAAHRQAFDELLTGLRRREGVLLMTGETGTGKTTLARAVVDALGARTFSALILNPYMSDAEVLRVILRDFGLVTREDIRHGAFANADVPQLLDALEGFLRSLVPLNSYAVVIIDEAQSLAPRVLDQIRVLGSYEQDGQRLLQIVLSGQPSLATTLKTESMRALNERISRRVALGPLQAGEVEGYIRHRLSIAGGATAVSFDADAVRLVADVSRSLPRRINMLCDRALEEGRSAGRSTIGADLVRRAAKALAGTGAPEDIAPIDAESETADQALMFGATPAPRRHTARWVLVTLLILIVLGAAGAGGYYAWRLMNRPPAPPPLPNAPHLAMPNLAPPPPPTDDEINNFGKSQPGGGTAPFDGV